MTADKLPLVHEAAPRCWAARWIFPITGPPIRDGWVQVIGHRIADFGATSPPGNVDDLGDVAILPQLVNAHTHLEFSNCQQPIGTPGTPLSDWIVQVAASRAGSTPAQRAAAVECGLQESRAAGVCLIGEISTPPCEYPTETDSPEVYSFAEVLGLSAIRSDERLSAAIEHLAERQRAGISPHAPYSTRPATIASCVELAITHNRAISMHVAESPSERELLLDGSGPFADTLKAMGAWQEGSFPWSKRPIIDLIDTLSAAPRGLIVHGNDLTDSEIKRLARYPHLTVVYCPRTHAFFRYDRHPVDRLLAAGVPVALGTDSRASNPDLDLWKDVQHLLQHRADLQPHQILTMATKSGANALGRPDLGRITVGAQAALATVPTTAQNLNDVYADLAAHKFQPLPI